MNIDFKHSLVNGSEGIDHILSTIRFYTKTLDSDENNKKLHERMKEIEWLYSKISLSFLNFIKTTTTIHSLLSIIENEPATKESKKLLNSLLNILNHRIAIAIHDATKMKRQKEKSVIMSYMKKHSSHLIAYIILCQKAKEAEELISNHV